ncbi:tRNA uridine 5-carboxymethylaminomethyl modification enzyme MnmG [Calidithermus terrae]|uniref:tRNA uridine 5-carboxymethylaminomethyl modification enzyme MnmG n=1 Tax=Calidithermus terrae TaxID=1408545 RepID=A0A399F1G1_9DEIN|nr:FAD-dependent oxidoreductase [Calidithermus terrae]RIH90617.1 tRNA uridine 5-carboxymethylaminomethyl modification enzyme MnmG [Calidithermus terrae]
MKAFTYSASVPVLAECDVLVVGGGSAGCSAAVAAARQGARVVLLERYGFLGGTGAAVLDTFYGFYTPGLVEKKVVGGIPDEVVGGLERRGVLLKRPNTYGAGAGLTYDPETLKVVWDELVSAAGVRVLLHAYFADVIQDGPRVRGAVVGTKRGLRAVAARAVVDASGDADVVARAGGPFEDAGALGIAQSLTTTFKVINVDVARAKSFPKKELWALMEAAASEGYRLPRKEGSAHVTPFQGVMVTNMTRVAGVDATDPDALSRAEMEGRGQALEYLRFLRDKVPGYERAELGGLSVNIGVRETRRIRGEYWITREDVLSARKFPDAVARCGAPIEEHHAGGDTRWEYLPDGETVDIPYRALLPQGLENVVVAGRCLSASHEAHASIRSIGQCLAMGQAAGLAAALAKGGDLRGVDVGELRSRLLEMGALL